MADGNNGGRLLQTLPSLTVYLVIYAKAVPSMENGDLVFWGSRWAKTTQHTPLRLSTRKDGKREYEDVLIHASVFCKKDSNGRVWKPSYQRLRSNKPLFVPCWGNGCNSYTGSVFCSPSLTYLKIVNIILEKVLPFYTNQSLAAGQCQSTLIKSYHYPDEAD